LLLVAVPAAAQDPPPDPVSTARLHLGPLGVTPKIGINDVGLDTNVYNDWVDPKKDFTATVVPQADFWMRLGPARLSGNANLGYTYFATFADQRSFNTDDAAKVTLPFRWVQPYVGMSYLSAHDRPGYDVDARVRHTSQAYLAGIDFPLTWRMTIGLSGKQDRIAFAGDAVFLATSLQQVFDRDVETLGGSFRFRLTPLTTFVVQADRDRELFRYSPIRNSTSLRVMPGIEFSEFALVSGKLSVGVRKLDMQDASIPDYLGVVASGELSWTAVGRTKFTLGVERDANYSFDVRWPYYLLSAATLTVTEQVRGPWDVQARGTLQRLDYRAEALAISVTPIGNTTDRVTLFGGGVGYRVGQRARVGLNVDYQTRRSGLLGLKYHGLRAGTSMTYGF
jgi:hypothetical protein